MTPAWTALLHRLEATENAVDQMLAVDLPDALEEPDASRFNLEAVAERFARVASQLHGGQFMVLVEAERRPR